MILLTMGNKVSLEEELVNLRIVSKQMQRSSKKCEKNEKAAIEKLKKVRLNILPLWCTNVVVLWMDVDFLGSNREIGASDRHREYDSEASVEFSLFTRYCHLIRNFGSYRETFLSHAHSNSSIGHSSWKFWRCSHLRSRCNSRKESSTESLTHGFTHRCLL